MVRTKVFVGNLSFQTKEAELAAEFGNAGKVISANIITRGPRSLGYGFVEMESEQDADNAVKVMNKKEINGRPINVEIAKPQDETKERAPRQPRQPRQNGQEGQDGGNESRQRKPRRRITRKREGEGEAQEKGETQNDEGKEVGRRPRRKPRNKATSTGEPGQKRVSDEQNREESKTTLFVANLPFALDDDAFGKVVTDAGLKLKTAHVVKKRNGRSKGYGFIEFDVEEDQKKALAALNKKVVESRELSVKIALTEIKREGEESKEAKPVEKKVVPEKKTTPVEKKATPPAEKKTGSPAPVEKKTGSPAPVEKKTGSPAPGEKKTGSPAPVEKKIASPAEKKAAPAEKKTPEKKDEKK